MRAAWDLLGGGLRRFYANRAGNVAMIFAFCVIPVIFVAGFAIDLNRIERQKQLLQNISDSAALTAARVYITEFNMSDSARLAAAISAASSMFNAQVAESGLSIEGLLFDVQLVDGQLFQVSASGAAPVTFASIAGEDVVDVAAQSTALSGAPGPMELVLVLDSTGSMSQSGRIQQLRDASEGMLDSLERAADDVQIAIVPFDTQVSVDGVSAIAGVTGNPLPIVEEDWDGCVVDREQSYDVTDDAASGGQPDTLYPIALCGTGSLEPVLELTDDFDAVRDRVSDLSPSGNTNITIGLAWGVEALTASAPLTGSDEDALRFVVLVTDGYNTENRWTTSGSDIDARTVLACDQVKTLADALYTVRLEDGNAALLESCASSPDHFYDVVNANALETAFADILADMIDIRLVQ